MDRRRDLDRLAGVIAEIQPDVIGLQEDLEGAGLRAHRSRLARLASDHLPVVAPLRVREVREPVHSEAT
jgi:endonuclease/exonuclease/phosphatase family metal-dependent hydrolase